MLNKENQRELCYIVRVDDIKPIEGKDRVECAVINSWTCMCPKGQFKPNDLGIYFEIDSKVDINKPEFNFLEKRHGKIKTQRFKAGDGHFYSQGLLMHPNDFGWQVQSDGSILNPNNNTVYKLGDFLTKELGVIYADEEDNKRKSNKSNPDKKYQRMMNRHPKFAKSKLGKWCMKYTFTKKLLFLILGRKRDGFRQFPSFVKVTDEERYQNLSDYIYKEYCKEPFYMTEKIDGSSGTFCMRGFGKQREYFVCSRTVVKDIKDKNGGYYDENIWAEVNEKYNLEKVCADILDSNKDKLNFITLQGEVYGKKVQKREYGLQDRDLALFNIIFGYKDGTIERLNPEEGSEFIKKYNVPFVPVLGLIKLPENKNELQALAASEVSKIDGDMREGIVFRSVDGVKSFKAVDNDFLVKYHG